MTYSLVLPQGVVVPDTGTIYAQVLGEWQAAFGNINPDPAQPQGVMIAAEVLAREAVANNNALLANQINPNLANGVFLDAICALLGIERRAGTPSRVQNVQLAGVASTTVPAGTVALDSNGVRWQSTRTVTLPAVVDFETIEPGAYPLPVGSLSRLETQVLGLETVYNPTEGTPGTVEEPDGPLRIRRRQTLALQGMSVSEAVTSALRALPGVTSVAYRENTSASAATIDGIAMQAHSIWACVDGGDAQAIAAALLREKTAGAGFNGSESVSVLDPHSGQAYTVQFDRPETVAVSVTVTGRQTGDRSIEPAAVIPQGIADWAVGGLAGDPGLQIGTPVSVYEVGFAANAALPGFQVASVELRVNGVVQPENVAVSLLQRARIGVNDVTVIVLP